ncbi:MAG: response regulator, partial [Candidatus Bathyarchaeota archaeon]
MRVLHIDDMSELLRFTKLFLEEIDASIEVVSVESPTEALQLFSSDTFDCILSDYQMPGMSGIELAESVRETSDIPFIIYTGRGSEEVAS